MLLDANQHYQLNRHGRYLWASLKRPHRVLSTCKVNGGLREDLTHLANHQTCEAVAHGERYVRNRAPLAGLDDFHTQACREAGLPPETTALMSTAANMQCAVLEEATHGDLRVAVAATAGVLGNATRAGDPAGWHETRDGCRPVGSRPGAPTTGTPEETGSGTIVLLVFISEPCTAACLTRAATMITEAKSTALLDLRMPSLQSAGLATGTGTDQLAIAAPMPSEDFDWERNWAGSHNLLGELLARATRKAVTRCLLLQNGVCAELRRSICAALGRHGCDEAALLQQAQSLSDRADAQLLQKNLTAVIHDPQSAAAAYALAEIIDLVNAGIIHAEMAQEAILNQAALLAAAVAVTPTAFAELREDLYDDRCLPPGKLAARAVALGFARKWR
jgi:adenosylcobinamide amidohydrolase